MFLTDLFHLLAETLRTQRLRSFLTILGIVVGMASVVLLTAIGEGTRAEVARQFTQFGTTIVSVMPGKSETFGRPGYVGGTTRRLTAEDALDLRRIPGVRHVAPNISGMGQVEAASRSRYTYVYGVVGEGRYVWQWGPRIGTFIPEGDLDHIPPVAVLGATTARELFPGENPLGAKVRVGQARFTVVGVMEAKGQMLGFDLDDSVYLPLRHAMRLFNRNQLQEIHLYVSSHGRIPSVVREARRILIERHNGEEDFTLLTNADMVRVVGSVMGVLTGGVIVIAAIAVFVGALGILTIMWVSVHERTSEIGLLKALGAGNGQVMAVFLAEAASLALFGGAAGTAVGAAGSLLLAAAVPGLWVHIPPLVFPVCWAVSLGVGIAAGLLPALKAARMDPVEALRAE